MHLRLVQKENWWIDKSSEELGFYIDFIWVIYGLYGLYMVNSVFNDG